MHSSLLKIITSLKYIAEQGLAIQRHNASDGHFATLLQLRSEDDDNLRAWLTRTSGGFAYISCFPERNIVDNGLHYSISAVRLTKCLHSLDL